MIPWLLAVALAAEPYTEAELVEVTDQAIDILPWQQYVVRTALKIDRPPSMLEASMYGAPAQLILPDGTQRGGSVIRFGMGFGVGVGQPRTGVAAFGGILADFAYVQDKMPPKLSDWESLAIGPNALFYGGLAAKGFAATASYAAHQPLYYEEQYGGSPSRSSQETLLTLSHVEGVSVGGALADAGGDTVLAAVTGLVRPEEVLERADLRRFGVFGLGLTRFASGIDPYREEANDADSPSLIEVPVSADDLGELGLRVSIVPQVTPRFALRRAVVGYVWEGLDRFLVGGQAGVVTRGGGPRPTIQIYASALGESEEEKKPLIGPPRRQRGLIALSYAYNAPDSVAFFPFDGAHVFGLQVVNGRQEFGRPLVPVYRSTEELTDDPATP